MSTRLALVTLAWLAGAWATEAWANDASPNDARAASCGAVTAAGCCSGQMLWWCNDQAQLSAVDCTSRAACGWSARGFYDCDTAGSADPSGIAARECDFGDAGSPVVDAGLDAGLDGSCGEVTQVGCCVGEVLVYCDRELPRAIACRRNLRCGWQASGQIYNCGTSGDEDPSGKAPMACGALPEITLPPADIGVDGAGDGSLDGRAEGGIDGGSARDGAGPPASSSSNDGCGCQAGGGGVPGLLGGLVALLLLGRAGAPRR